MTTFDIYQTAETRERYTVNAESFEEALRLHEDGQSTFKDSETLEISGLTFTKRATGESKTEFDIAIGEESA